MAVQEAGEAEELYVLFENTTKGHALKNIPLLREALQARGVPVWIPEPEAKTEPQEGGLFT